MWRGSIRSVWAALVLLALCNATVVTGCGRGSATTTAEETTATVEVTTSVLPGWTWQDQAQLQARAMRRAKHEFTGAGPPCVSTDTPAEVRAALDELFGDRMVYYEPGEGLVDRDTGQFRCSGLVVEQVERLSDDVVRISAGVVWGPTSGRGTWYYFQWDGTTWVDAEPDPGVVVTGWSS